MIHFNKISKGIGNVIIILFIAFVLLNETRRSMLLKAKTHDYIELRNDYRNYQIIEKKCLNDTCYYLRLENPVDSIKENKLIKVKDYIYFNWFVGDYIK